MRRIIAKGLVAFAIVVAALGVAAPAMANTPLTPTQMAALSVHQGCVFFNAWVRWGSGDRYDGTNWLANAANLHGLAGTLASSWAPLAADTAAIQAAWTALTPMHTAALARTETVCAGITSF
jgi:hypothetical protein